MKKVNILSKNKDFQRIIESRNQIVTSFLVLYFESKDINCTKMGISISKKLGNAVFRNRTKREIKRNLELCLDLNLKYNIVLIIRKQYSSLVSEDKLKELEYILNKFNKKRRKRE